MTFTATGMDVLVRSTTTIWDARDAGVIPVAAAPGSPYCPIRATYRAMNMTPGTPECPLFLDPTTGCPLTGVALTSLLRTVLRHQAHPLWARVTLHSLRHAGATMASMAGASIPEIMEQGTWTTRAVHTYLSRRVPSSVSACVTGCLALDPKD